MKRKSNYQPLVNLWNHQTQERIRNGSLQLQCGQWVYCGNREHPSRFVALRGDGSLWVAHWQGSGKASRERFMALVRADRVQRLHHRQLTFTPFGRKVRNAIAGRYLSSFQYWKRRAMRGWWLHRQALSDSALTAASTRLARQLQAGFYPMHHATPKLP